MSAAHLESSLGGIRVILKGEPIPVFNNGDQKRDFAYLDDIVDGVLACVRQAGHFKRDRPHRIYNIGNNRPVPLMRFIDVLESAIGRRAIRDFRPMVRAKFTRSSPIFA